MTDGRRMARLRVGAGALMLAVVGAVGLAPQAHAATCYGSGCNGKAPVGTTCANDAVTLWSRNVSYGEGVWENQLTYKAELRYSPSCGASWTRATGKINFTRSDGPTSYSVRVEIWSRLDPSLPVSAPAPVGYAAERTISTASRTSFQFSSPMASDTTVDQVSACRSTYTSRRVCSGYMHL
ncbi:MAG: DUF2690 domain-containing protein [Kineosporiaceae bacterium]